MVILSDLPAEVFSTCSAKICSQDAEQDQVIACSRQVCASFSSKE